MKMQKKTDLQIIQDHVEVAVNEVNKVIEELGEQSIGLYDTLTNIQELFDKIRNVPSKKKLQIEKLNQRRNNWKQQAEKIERDYQKAANKNIGTGVAGASLGVAVVTMGPTIAMGVATTFGVASTGTAISTLSGAAATNAALAWLGGGTLAAGGGGMALGQTLLYFTGPVGWTISGVSLAVSGLIFWISKSNKKTLENIFISAGQRDIKSYELAIVELKERIARVIDERKKLNAAIDVIQTFGTDYSLMTEAQQYELGAYVNLMYSSTQLLTSPIRGLMPKFSINDFYNFLSWKDNKETSDICEEYKKVILMLTNLLYKIELDDKEKIVLWKSLRKNKQILDSMKISKKAFNAEILDIVFEALKFKYVRKTY